MNLGKYFWKNKLIILLFFMLFISILKPELTLARSNTDDIHEFQKPSQRPIKILGLWSPGGFNQQPLASYSTKAGDDVHIKSHSVTPGVHLWGDPNKFANHTWRYSTDRIFWQEIPNEKSSDIIIHTEKPGNIYYQVKDTYRKFTFYSDIATVHVLPNDVKAIDIKEINLTNNYIYNSKNEFDNNTASATATLIPALSTAKVSWSVDRPELATIDNLGNITAKDKAEGSFFVTATAENKDGSKVSKAVLMNVGGGLYDQKARAGTKATFKIQGFDNNLRDESNTDKPTVIWYIQKGNNKPQKQDPPIDDPFTFVTKTLTKEDDQEDYYAVIKVGDIKMTTSKGRLTVLPAENPNVILTNKIQNISGKDPEDTDVIAKNIVNNDSIRYDMLLNNSGQQDLHDNTLSLFLYRGTTINSIKIDDIEIPPTRYPLKINQNQSNELLELNVGDLFIGKKRHVVIDTITKRITEQRRFASRPYFIGKDTNNNSYQSIGEKLELTYITNQLTTHFNNIVFDPIVNFQGAMIKHRTDASNVPNDIVYIDDQRKKKHPLKIMLEQAGQLTNENKLVLDASLMLHKPDSAPVPITSPQEVTNSVQDEPLKSVAWKRDEGLLLHVKGGYMPAGQYHTTLTWCIKDAP